MLKSFRIPEHMEEKNSILNNPGSLPLKCKRKWGKTR